MILNRYITRKKPPNPRKQGLFDAESTATVLWIGFLGGLVTGLSLSALVLVAHALI